jgi:hypothetical protein
VKEPDLRQTDEFAVLLGWVVVGLSGAVVGFVLGYGLCAAL